MLLNEFNKTEGPEGHYNTVKTRSKNTVKCIVKLQSRTTH